MTNLLYRSTATATPPTASIVKGSPITITEFDANLKSLSNDVNLKAPLASPNLTGIPSTPTAAPGTDTTQIATTAFVIAEIATKAPLASPNLTGIPTSPTASQGTNSSQLSTTAFVVAEILAERTTTNTSISNERISVATLTNKTLTNPAGTTITLTDGVNVSWDMNLGQLAYWSITGTGRTLLAPTNFKHGVIYTLMVFCANPVTQSPNLPSGTFKLQYDVAPDFTTSTCTILSIIWSPIHNKFIVIPAPGL
jgi:hypothetical protein